MHSQLKTMKFREGIHSKFTRANNDYILEFVPGWSLSNNQLHHAKSQHLEDKSSVSRSEIYDGSQKIRTVGKDLIVPDLETSILAIRVKNMIKSATLTEYELKVVNEKLEKKLLTSKNRTKHEAIVNPLQHYVVSSKGGFPQPARVTDRRTSLWQLFQKTKMADEKNDRKSNIRNQTEKKSINSVKTILEKKSAATSVVTIDSASAEKKLNKILRMLHMVFPKCSAMSQKFQNLWKYVANSNFDDNDIIKLPYRAISETSANHTKSKVCNSVYDTNRKREYWIKSDAKYVILEL